MDPEQLIGSVIRGVLGGRRKKSRGAMRVLTGRGGLLSSPQALIALAGVAWGVYETMTRSDSGASAASAPAGPSTPTPALPRPTVGGTTASSGVPPVPVTPQGPQVEGTASSASVDPLLRVLRLCISAARADGTLTDTERAAILAQAKASGIESTVAAELDRTRPLAEIVAGVADPAMRKDLYRLAFTIVRGDENVSGAERVYLAQLAHRLELAPDTVASLEQESAARIDEAAKT
jgi:uncharacterized membrane protein YebE (DUF533 family)